MKSRFSLSAIILAVLMCGAIVRAAQEARPLLIVLSKPEAKAQLIDPATRKVVAEIATGTGPHEVTVSADGKLAFVANYGDQTPGESISVIDLSAHKELRRVNLGAASAAARDVRKQVKKKKAQRPDSAPSRATSLFNGWLGTRHRL